MGELENKHNEIVLYHDKSWLFDKVGSLTEPVILDIMLYSESLIEFIQIYNPTKVNRVRRDKGYNYCSFGSRESLKSLSEDLGLKSRRLKTEEQDDTSKKESRICCSWDNLWRKGIYVFFYELRSRFAHKILKSMSSSEEEEADSPS